MSARGVRSLLVLGKIGRFCSPSDNLCVHTVDKAPTKMLLSFLRPFVREHEAPQREALIQGKIADYPQEYPQEEQMNFLFSFLFDVSVRRKNITQIPSEMTIKKVFRRTNFHLIGYLSATL